MSKNIFSNEAFASYADRLGELEYSYGDCLNCGLAGYLKFLGFKNVLVGGNNFDFEGRENVEMPPGWADALSTGVRTYAALAARLRAIPNAI